jgi:hypothetical protein
MRRLMETTDFHYSIKFGSVAAEAFNSATATAYRILMTLLEESQDGKKQYKRRLPLMTKVNGDGRSPNSSLQALIAEAPA